MHYHEVMAILLHPGSSLVIRERARNALNKSQGEGFDSTFPVFNSRKGTRIYSRNGEFCVCLVYDICIHSLAPCILSFCGAMFVHISNYRRYCRGSETPALLGSIFNYTSFALILCWNLWQNISLYIHIHEYAPNGVCLRACALHHCGAWCRAVWWPDEGDMNSDQPCCLGKMENIKVRASPLGHTTVPL